MLKPAQCFRVPVSTILSKWIGEAEKNIHDLFEEAKETAEKTNSFSLILIDEIDELIAARGNCNQIDSEHDKLLAGGQGRVSRTVGRAGGEG